MCTRPRRAVDLLARARELVQPLAADLDRRHHRRDLVDVADEQLRGGLDLLTRHRHRAAVEHLTGGVERARGDAEHDLAPVLLVGLLQEPQQPGDAAEADEEHARGVGVEGARVADAALPVDACGARDDVVRRPARGLVDDDEPVELHWHLAAGARSERGGDPRDEGVDVEVGGEPRREPMAATAVRLRDATHVDVAERAEADPDVPSSSSLSTHVTSASAVRRKMSMRPSTSSSVTS